MSNPLALDNLGATALVFGPLVGSVLAENREHARAGEPLLLRMWDEDGARLRAVAALAAR